MKPVSYKRIFAYIIDIMIISIISTLITSFIPLSSEYQRASDELYITLEDYNNEEITNEEYLEKVNEISYIANRESVSVSIITILIAASYFVILPYYMNGQTLGKKLMKIKVVSSNNKKLNILNYLIRSLFVGSILLNTINVITILFLSKDLYLKTYNITSTIFGAIYLVIFSMILFRKDGMGLHDMIAKTKVINKSDENIGGSVVVSDNDSFIEKK